jgi:serine/threonine-protein kinase
MEINPPLCRIVDLNSSNGTFVNRKRITAVALRDKDVLQAGRTAVRVRIKTANLAETGPVSSAPEFKTTDLDQAASDASPNIEAEATQEFHASAGELSIPGYRLVKQLGEGGMGIVHLAVRIADNEHVAIKTIRPAMAASKRELDLFLREAAVLMQLEHPRIVRFREMGRGEGYIYLSMDYVRGLNAAELVRSYGPLPIQRAVSITCDLLEALKHAHSRGFVHRDVKPSNVLVTNGPDGEVAMLADFGLARTYQDARISGLTLLGDMRGTIAFMAPEQILQSREAKPEVDQYSAAATLYFLLTAKLAHELAGLQLSEQLSKILSGKPIPLQACRSDVPDEVVQIVSKGLSANPAARYASTGEMLAALQLVQK